MKARTPSTGRDAQDRRSDPLAIALGRYAAKHVRFRVGRLIGRYGFTQDDRDDLEQELALDLLRRLPRFDAERASLNTFIGRVVDHAVATIAERQKAARRDYRRRVVSLDAEVELEDGVTIPFGQTLDAEAYLRLTSATTPVTAESLHLQADLKQVIRSLPEHLQEICLRLAIESVAETSRQLAIPRTSLYDRIKEIRAHFERADLREYL